jgi:hypothetical protein
MAMLTSSNIIIAMPQLRVAIVADGIQLPHQSPDSHPLHFRSSDAPHLLQALYDLASSDTTKCKRAQDRRHWRVPV